VNYTEGVIRNTEFFTTSELAEKLKMNVQVITRKVQAGEIRAYKIGKEWRIPEPSVYEWLESNANSPGQSPRKANGARDGGRPTPSDRLPSDAGQRRYLLEYLLAQFEPSRLYGEKEVDRIITRHHRNAEAARQELVALNMLELDDGHYRRRNGYKLAE
jgi:excisionase family DNA binding protein